MESTLTTSTMAKTQFVEAAGIRFAYRIVGKPTTIPLVLLQHFTGTMDDWDPAVIDQLAQHRQLILFNNTGVASSAGKTPDTIAQMATDATAFIRALRYPTVDMLGFSIGGFIAQLISADQPSLVHKLILVGTGPQGGDGIRDFRIFLQEFFKREGFERYLYTFFEKSTESRSLGLSALNRILAKTTDRDPVSSMQTIEAQTKAIVDWGLTQDNDYNLLKKITQPVMVVNGSNDAMFPTINSYQLFQHLPNAQLNLYPDAAHGSLNQYPDLFVEQANFFLTY